VVGIEIEIRSTTFALLISVGMTSTLLVIPLSLLFGMLVIPKRVKRVECISVLIATALGSLAQGRQFQAPLHRGGKFRLPCVKGAVEATPKLRDC